MKALSVVLVLAIAMVFAMAGCNDNTGPLVAPDTQAEVVSLAKNGVVHSATGGGHVFAFYGTWEYNGLVTFSAIEHSGGRFSGQIQAQFFPADISFVADVIDLKVEDVTGGRLAKMSGELRNTKGVPPEWNAKNTFIVIFDSDNGEDEYHRNVGTWPEGGYYGYTTQELIDMTPTEWIANIPGQGEWLRVHGEWTVR